MEEIEAVVLQNLMNSEYYYSKAFSHLDDGLFQDPNYNTIFKTIKELTKTYNQRPNPKEVGLSIKQNNKLNKTLQHSTLEKFKNLLRDSKVENLDFLVDQTQKWVQRQRLTKTILEAAEIIQNDGAFESIPSKVEESLNINFDTSIGLNYQESINERLDYYKSKEAFTPIGLPKLDEVLGGGIRPGSLFMFIGPTHTGKTAAKVFTTANLLSKKENVLFITLEMPEKEIAKRIDANLMGLQISSLSDIPNDEIMTKWKQIEDKIGKLVIKEYGAGTFNGLLLKSLLDELKTKKGFIPDAIVVDYIGLMVSARANKDANSYDGLGKVAEDLHAIGKETYNSKGTKGVKVISSSQAGRAAIGNTEAGMENISESLKIAMTADVAIMLINNDQMREQNQQIWKIVKNRYTGLMPSLMMETDFTRMTYKDFGGDNAYEAVDQLELNTSPAQDFGTLGVGKGIDTVAFNF